MTAGAEGSRWAFSSSKRAARRSASRGGFDSHALPPVEGQSRAMLSNRPPSVDAILRAVGSRMDGRDRAAVVAVARSVVADERGRIAAGSEARSAASLGDVVLARLSELKGPAGSDAQDRTAVPHPNADAGLTPVINATGVLLHTNREIGRTSCRDSA